MAPRGARRRRVELCTSDDVRDAHQRLLSRLPRPLHPQPPSLTVLRAPIWSTWARYKMAVDQRKVLNYANEIAAHRFPRSHLEIDDKWSVKYGDLTFDPSKFGDVRGMVRMLHGLGFRVTLWVTPFAEPGSAAFKEGQSGGYWLMRRGGGSARRGEGGEGGEGGEVGGAPEGEPALVTWWQGRGAALNVSSPRAVDWFEGRLRRLMAATGVDGFKFDAGEAQFVLDASSQPTSGGKRAAFATAAAAPPEPNSYCARWASLASRFGGGSEVRCACHSQGVGIWTREFDKDSRWGVHNGLRALLTSALQLGTVGYPFVLPDMVKRVLGCDGGFGRRRGRRNGRAGRGCRDGGIATAVAALARRALRTR